MTISFRDLLTFSRSQEDSTFIKIGSGHTVPGMAGVSKSKNASVYLKYIVDIMLLKPNSTKVSNFRFFTGNNNDLVLSLNSSKNEDLSGEIVGKKWIKSVNFKHLIKSTGNLMTIHNKK